MSQQMTPQEAEQIVFDLHKRAFLGRLRDHGVVPSTEKEAQALVDLGLELSTQIGDEPVSGGYDYGDGPFAHVKRAFDQMTSSQEIAPGIPAKQASAQLAGTPSLPPGLEERAYDAAYQLAHDPAFYNAAVIKRAMIEASYADAAIAEAK